jgi:hypothetical protein
MFMAREVRAHAVEVLHGSGPVHIAVAHQREIGVDTFGREGLGQRFIDRHVFHGDIFCSMECGKPWRAIPVASTRPDATGIALGRWIGPGHAATLPLKYDGRRNKCA